MNHNEIYNTTGFLAQALIEQIDKLEGTTGYKFKLKQYGNLFLRELEKLNHEHRMLFEANTEAEIDLRDVHNVLSIGYDRAVQFFQRPANEIAIIMNAINKMEFDFHNDKVEYKPLIK